MEPPGRSPGPSVSPGQSPSQVDAIPDWCTVPKTSGTRLECFKADKKIEELPLSLKYALLGRQASSNFVLDHQSISRQHAAIAFDPQGDVYIIDLHSAHGTFVDGKRIQPKLPFRLSDGAAVTFGGSTRTYILRGAVDTPPPLASDAGSPATASPSPRSSPVVHRRSPSHDRDKRMDESANGTVTARPPTPPYHSRSELMASPSTAARKRKEDEERRRADKEKKEQRARSDSEAEAKRAKAAPRPGEAGEACTSNQVHCAHVLVKHAQSRRPSSWKQETITRSKEEALAIIAALRARIVSGAARFEEVARAESDCSSAKKGGDLGFFGRGQMQRSFENAACARPAPPRPARERR
eukprot:tig00020801_g13926.t1